MSASHREKPVVLDPQTLAAVQKGLERADEESVRWTTEQVIEDAKAVAQEWKQVLKTKASA